MRRAALGALALVAMAVVVREARGEDERTWLPLPVPDRPFLLVEAPRRFLPSEPAEVRVELAGGGPVEVAVLRVHDPVALLAQGPARQGIAVAATPLGRASEALIARPGPLPRRGSELTLVALREERLEVRRGRGRVSHAGESAVYDSYEGEESDVETWGVRSGAWASASVPLGRLPAGLYLVRVARGAWAGSTVLSVGHAALLVRRGDLHDDVRVLGPDGAPRANVRVEARDGASMVAAGVTDAEGALRLPASDRERLRFVARDGAEDIAWADVAHARMSACDPRVFVGTGRPVFRPGEVIHVRGHVRGCDARGDEHALPDEPLVLFPGEVAVRSDAHGDFVAELIAPADGILRALVRGHESVRDVTIDHRRLPERALSVRVDRGFAAAGESVQVEVADEDGGWPSAATVSLRTPVGTLRSEIGPARPARFRFVMPRSDQVVERVALEASLAALGRVQTARAELWTGRRPEIVELASERSHGQQNARLPVRARASDLSGAGRSGPILVTLHGSDGNARGPERGRWEVTSEAEGWAALDVELRGAGPWWIEARRGESVASLVVRDRPGPPQLGARGELAVAPRSDVVEPGGTLEVDVRMRAGSAVWLTLEQGSVHASRLVRAGSERVRLAVPREARGMATVVATEVSGAEVRQASASVEVRTSRPMTLRASADRRTYAEGDRARVVLEGRDAAGAPRDAVVSVWMADAGWWELGDERHPPPAEYFRIAGRPASAGDGSAPVAYGAEEGRHVDAWMEWNGVRVERATFRHGWGHGGALVALDVRGSLRDAMQALARAAGLRGAVVCPEANAELGAVSLRAQQLPWDLIALRAHERAQDGLEAEALDEPHVRGGWLRLDCGGGGIGMSGGGAGGGGSGYGSGAGGFSARPAREERLEGTLFFLGRVALGEDGRAEIEVPLPAAPGRWRIEALAIAEDGGGGSASAVVHTTRPVVATLHAPARLAVGDEGEIRVDVLAPGAAGQRAEIVIAGDGAVVLDREGGVVSLDARGRGSLVLRARAAQEGAGALVVEARAGGASDAVRARVEVAPSAVAQPVALRAVVGPGATDTAVPLPPRLRDAMLRVRIGGDVVAQARERLEVLRAPRWQVPGVRLDRLGALLALARALEGEDAASPERDEVQRAVVGEASALLAAIDGDAAGDGSLSHWGGLGRDDAMTGELVWGLAPWRDGAALRAGWVRAADALRARLDAGEVDAREAPVVAAGLARAGDHERARRALSGARLDDADALVWAVRAARAMGDPAGPYGARLERAIDAMFDARGGGATCDGPTWFLCYARQGERARMARAAEALLESGRPGARDRAARVAARIAERPSEVGGGAWGDADADVLALLARLEGERGEVAAVVVQGERRLARVRGDASVVVPAGDEPVVLRFEGARGRFVVVAVDGVVEVDAARAGRGRVAVERRFVSEDGGRFAEVELELARDAREVSVVVPLPAGLELAARAGEGAVGVRGRGRPFTWWGPEVDAGPEVPRMVRDASGIALRWERLRAGRYVVRVPVIETGRGRFTAGAVVLRTADPAAWGMAPAVVME